MPEIKSYSEIDDAQKEEIANLIFKLRNIKPSKKYREIIKIIREELQVKITNINILGIVIKNMKYPFSLSVH